MTHTPGPWRFEPDGSINARDIEVATVEVNALAGPELAEAIADGHLIAAAPDLLAALKGLLPEDFDEHPDDFMPDWHAARAAVAKAEGAA